MSPSCADASFLPNGPERDWGFADIEISEGEVVHDLGEQGTEHLEEAESESGMQVVFDKSVLISLGLHPGDEKAQQAAPDPGSRL